MRETVKSNGKQLRKNAGVREIYNRERKEGGDGSSSRGDDDLF